MEKYAYIVMVTNHYGDTPVVICQDKATAIKEIVARVKENNPSDFFEEYLCMTPEELEKRLFEEATNSSIGLYCLEGICAIKVSVK